MKTIGRDEAPPLWANLVSALIVLLFTGLAVYEVQHLKKVLCSTEYVLTAEQTVGPEPNTPGALVAPAGLAADAGHVYVTDLGEKSLRIYSAGDGRLLETVTKGGDGTSDLVSPAAVTVAPDGSVQVIDSATGRIERYTPDGVPADSSFVEGLYGPHALAVAANGDRLIADSGGRRIICISPAGIELWAYKGSDGSGGPLAEPRGVAIDGRGHVVFIDIGTARVHELEAGGAPVRSARLSGNLMALAVTGQWILVTATTPESLWLVDQSGETFRLDDGTGRSFLSNPQGVAVDPNGRVWIVTGGQVRRYGLAKRR